MKRGTVLVAMAATLAMVFFDQSAVAVALPEIRTDLGLSPAQFQWVMNGYLLAVAAFSIAGGRISDRLGHPKGAALAILIFIAGSILAGAAQSPEWLIAARVLQGLGGGTITSSCAAIVSDAYREEHRGKALGIYWGIAGLALALGPLLGGVITELGSWRGIFWVNPFVAVAVAPVLLRLVRSAKPPSDAGGRIDLLGAALLVTGLALLVAGLHSFVPPLLGSGLAVLGIFVLVERRNQDPLLDFSLFADSRIVAALLVVALTRGVIVFTTIYVADYLQTVLGLGPSIAGAALIPATAMLVAGSMLGGRATDRFGPRIPSLLGCIGAVLGMLWLGLLVTDELYLVLIPGLMMFGLGVAFAETPMQVTVLNRVATDQRAVAGALLGTCRQAGGALGLAVLSGIVAHRSASSGLASAMEWAFIFGAGFVIAAIAAIAVLMPAGRVHSRS